MSALVITLSRSWLRGFPLISLLLVLASAAAAASNPVITSPPPNSGPAWSPGADPTLAESGVIEEEFFIEGTATAVHGGHSALERWALGGDAGHDGTLQ